MSDDKDSLGSGAMEEDEDDLYGDSGTNHSTNAIQNDEEDDEEEYEPEEDESDSDIEIVTERQPGDETVTAPATKTNGLSAAAAATAATTSTTNTTESQTLQATTVPQTLSGVDPKTDGTIKSQVTLLSGKSYPEVRTSNVDFGVIPVHDGTGKPITEVQIDADLAEQEKPWRHPGADQSDYFNYGFDEFTWSTYCLRQKNMAQTIGSQSVEMAQMENMFGSGGMPGMPQMPQMPQMQQMPQMPGMPTMGGMPPDMGAMAGMPGMPDQQQFEQMMQQAMIKQGVNDPSQLDFDSVFSEMMGGMGMPTPQQAYGSGGGNWQQPQQQQQQPQQQQQQGGYPRGGSKARGRR